jgi:hypothetical protein
MIVYDMPLLYCLHFLPKSAQLTISVFHECLGKGIHEYKGEGCRVKKIAELLDKGKGDLVYYYDTYKEVYVGKGKNRRCKKIKSFSVELEPENLYLDSYKELLLKKLKDSLEITGFNMTALKQEIGQAPIIDQYCKVGE